MKTLTLITALAAMAAASSAQADDLAEVRAVLKTEIRVFATYDAKLSAQVYAPDVIWQNPFGVRIYSEPEVERFLTRLFQRPGFRSGKDITAPVVTDVKLIGPDAAIAWSEETSKGQIEDGKPLGLRKSHYLEVLRKRDGQWRVSDEMIMDEK